MTLRVEKGAGREGSLPWSAGSSAVRASSVGVERKNLHVHTGAKIFFLLKACSLKSLMMQY